MGRLEALPLHGVVRVEAQEHAAARGQDGLGLLAPAEAAQDGGLGVTPVVHLQVVIGTLRLGLDVHLHEGLEGVREDSELGVMWPGAGGMENRWHQTKAPGPQFMDIRAVAAAGGWETGRT